MCALFTLRASLQDLTNSLVGLSSFHQNDILKDWNHRFLPHQNIPVVIHKKGQLRLELMNFSLIPNWSKVRRPKFATHNARLETITEKPTWKKPFLSHHALIPLTEFIEPVYEGPHSHHMLGFSSLNDEILWAAGLWEEWLNIETGEIILSASIITHNPSPFVREMGHDREPLFIGSPSFARWLGSEGPFDKTDAATWVQFLRVAHSEPQLKVRRDRPLKKKA